MAQRDEEDEERRRQTKLEEALEVKSLRRIISAYLNYPEAAEEDVKRYERSFKKLPPAHKALLSHLSLKFQRLRECISANSYFIFSMLQAFEPPLDLSQHIDCCEDYPIEEASNRQIFTGERDACSCHSTSACQSTSLSNSNEVCPKEGNSFIRNSPSEVTPNKEVVGEGHYDSFAGSRTSHLECSKEIERFSNNDANGIDSCGNVCSSTHDWLDPSLQSHVPLVDVDKVRCIIRNIVRDWAAEGHIEREQCYKPILEELDTLFPNRSEDSPPACLVPGAGLGRLALEISCLAGEWEIYPWIHSNCNSISDSDQLRPVLIPDIHPASAGITKGFSMCGGDFIEVYGDPSQVGIWDAVVTCFFIDTAHNVVEYIEIISRILKDGGVWINLGPLLYHFAEMYGQQDEMSIELSLEDVKKVALHYGFQLEKEKVIETTYTTNPRSMMQNRYFAAFWTMRKKSPGKENTP